MTAMLVELSVFLLLSDKFGQTQITVWQFWLVTLTFYITCHQLMVGLLQNFSVETIIKTKHIEAGHGDMQLKAFPLVVVITFIITLILIQKKLQQENRLLEAATHLSEAPLKPTADQPRKEAEYVLVHEGQTVKIELSKILYIQVTENYCHLWVQQEKSPYRYIQRMALEEAKIQLSADCFVQCHRSYVVNLNYVSQSKKRDRDVYLLIKNIDVEIPVSRNRVT